MIGGRCVNFDCPEGFTMTGFNGIMGGQCLRVFNEPKSWNDAQESCEALNASLATIGNYEQNRWVYDHISGPTWLGLTDSVNEGFWTRVDGGELPFQNWYIPELAGGTNEDCGVFDGSRWRDHACNQSLPYVCGMGNVHLVGKKINYIKHVYGVLRITTFIFHFACINYYYNLMQSS